MKKFIFLLAMTCSFFIAQAQVTQIPNNDFEQLNSNGTLRNWGNVYLMAVYIDSMGVSHGDSLIYDDGYYYRPTTDAHSGQYAMLLSNAHLRDANENIVGSASSDEDSVFTAWGSFEVVNYALRPQSFSFYYKFSPENNDTAMVSLILYDEWANPLSEVNYPIIGAQNTYQLVNIPLTYFTPNNAVIGYSLNIRTFSSLEPNGLRTCSMGTRLWIDDISLNNVTNIASSTANSSLHIYPNPAQHSFSIQTKEQVKSLSLIDITGKVQSMSFNNLNEIDCSGLAKGMYFIKVETEKGMLMEKLEVE